MGLQSSLSKIAKAESIIISDALRRWSASDSGEVEVLAIVLVGRTGASAFLYNAACSILLLKVAGRMLVLCVCDGDFMVFYVVVNTVASHFAGCGSRKWRHLK
jgi:hypothetical protein